MSKSVTLNVLVSHRVVILRVVLLRVVSLRVVSLRVVSHRIPCVPCVHYMPRSSPKTPLINKDFSKIDGFPESHPFISFIISSNNDSFSILNLEKDAYVFVSSICNTIRKYLRNGG
jgi:hypothetical protein